MSSGGRDSGVEKREYYRQRKINSCTLRRSFLNDCLEEQVLPKCAPKQLTGGDKPFSEAARTYLQEACNQLSYRIDEIRSQNTAAALPSHLREKLLAEERKQQERLSRKLEELCRNSEWNHAGRADLVRNLSGVYLSETELQALSLGLKFDSGLPRLSYQDFLSKNYRWDDKDIEHGFKQGVIACYQALAESEKCGLPRRFLEALKGLGKRSDIVLLPADKGGGIVVMRKSEYVEKMTDLLDDGDTYRRKDEGFAEREAIGFKKEVRRILSGTDRGKKLLWLLEEAPRPPKMRGLPKVHKPGIPMRPITSGIGSAPHRLAKRLARPLSAAMGTISSSHLRNSSDLIERIKRIDMTRKKLASFDVKALFTNVPVEGAMETVEKVVEKISDSDLPIRKEDYVKLVSLCVNFGCFTFNGQEFVQHRGLAMGSPLSAVMASLYMESLEEDRFVRIMGRGTSWFRYVDDVLVVMPENTNVQNKLRRLNSVNEHIQFTVELESDGKLPFLDTLLHRANDELKFSIYRKPTNTDDFVHYLSQHDDRTKSGVVIGFFLRAFRICSPEFLHNECEYIVKTFNRLMYPLGLINRLKKKAEAIWRRTTDTVRTEKRKDYIVVPYSRTAERITRFLLKSGVNIVHSSGLKIRDNVMRNQDRTNKNKDSAVYKIPCGGCSAAYYGETSRGVATRIREHKNDMRLHRTANSMVVHAEEYGHLPDWTNTETLHVGLNRLARRTVEAAYIVTEETTNHKDGFIKLARAPARIIAAEVRSNKHQSGSEGGAARAASLPVNQPVTRPNPRQPVR